MAGWTGMRGIVTLAAALAVPTVSLTGEALPYRGRIVIISFAVILVTLVLQGLTLAPLIRLLGLQAMTVRARANCSWPGARRSMRRWRGSMRSGRRGPPIRSWST